MAAGEIILASASPRRKVLMERLGRPFRTVVVEVDETIPPGLSGRQAAEELACRKARTATQGLAEGVIVGADTLVELNGRIIGKPADMEDAVRILTDLSGSRHDVITGLCIRDAASGRELTGSEVTRIVMRRMSQKEIEAYVASGESDGKAGAYAIQQSGDRYVERVEGSMDNVVGLPVRLLERMLDELGKDEH